MKKLIERQNEIREEMKNMLAGVKTEGRAFTDEEKVKFETLKGEYDNIEDTLTIEDKIDALTEHKVKESELETKDKAEVKAFANFLRSKGVVNTGEVTKGDNGAIIPTTIAQKIIDVVTEVCPIYAKATKYYVKGTLNIPKYVKNSNDDVTVGYGTEFTAPSSHSGKFESISLTGFYINALVEISEGLIGNSDIDLVNFFINKMASKFARFLEKEFLYGTTGKIEGVVNGYDSTDMKVTLAKKSTITADELIDIQDKVIDTYQFGAEWYMNSATRKAIRKLKDGQGNYLLNPDFTAKWGYTLLGKPVYTSDNIVALGGASKEVIFYGDFSGLAVKIRKDIAVSVLNDSYFQLRNSIGILGKAEVDAKVENTQKIVVAVSGASDT